MDDKYLPSLGERKETLFQQIEECKRIIYRNSLENVMFVANNETARQKEVEYNNELLSNKIDVLIKEWEKFNDESLTDYENSRGAAITRPTV